MTFSDVENPLVNDIHFREWIYSPYHIGMVYLPTFGKCIRKYTSPMDGRSILNQPPFELNQPINAQYGRQIGSPGQVGVKATA